VVDTLSSQYESRPVVFLEDYFYAPQGDRLAKFWAAYEGSSVSFPAIMVCSGHQISNGYVDFVAVYSAMVDSELARAPEAALSATRQRVGDTVHVEVQVTNQSGVTLSSANSARVHVIVFEDSPAGVSRVTERYVRGAEWTAISPSLDHGAMASFTLDVDLTGVSVDWSKLHAVALVDYRPGGLTGPFDMLQAVFLP